MCIRDRGDDALLDALRDRIRFVLAICDELGREKLVLGAWGCDNNGFDAEACLLYTSNIKNRALHIVAQNSANG